MRRGPKQPSLQLNPSRPKRTLPPKAGCTVSAKGWMTSGLFSLSSLVQPVYLVVSRCLKNPVSNPDVKNASFDIEPFDEVRYRL